MLVSHARRLAQTYPQGLREVYVQAANELRSPFWDWAASSVVPPASVPAKVTINVPNGDDVQEEEVDNPLSSYKIPQQVLNGQYGTFDPDNRPRTIRCPPPQTYPDSANDLLGQRPYRQWVVRSAMPQLPFSAHKCSMMHSPARPPLPTSRQRARR